MGSKAKAKQGSDPSGLTLVYRFCLVPALLLSSQTATAADEKAGRSLLANRQQAMCLLCHTAPIPEEQFQGNLAPDLSDVADRLSGSQLRQKIAESTPGSIMPAYAKAEGLNKVAPAHKGKPILTGQQIDDIVAYLQTLKNKP